jgi:hypothetical protein
MDTGSDDLVDLGLAGGTDSMMERDRALDQEHEVNGRSISVFDM